MAEFSFLDIDATMEPMNHFAELNPNSMENPHLNFHSLMMGGFSADNFFMQQQQPLEFPANLGVNFPGIFHLDDDKSAFQVSEAPLDVSEGNESKKRKSIDLPESSSGNSSPPVSEDVFIPRKNNSRRGKKIKGNEKGEEKPKEVVHVRARRGQATDSHSLAERVRRGKINEKLRCLQGIVPGCYKTMGMAVMLDEIINYVQSLQNQVEFLSMKLTAASRYYDFNLDTDAVETLQRAKAYEVQSLSGEGFHHQGLNSSISTQHHASFDLSFGSYPSLPYNS